MHSFASDLWAFGCVLHEMLAGRPPFYSSSFQQLQQMVLHEPTPLTAGASPELQSLLAAVLRKGPLERAEWPAVRMHPFWQGRPPGNESDSSAVPVQPHLEELRKAWQKAQNGSLTGQHVAKSPGTAPATGPAGQSPAAGQSQGHAAGQSPAEQRPPAVTAPADAAFQMLQADGRDLTGQYPEASEAEPESEPPRNGAAAAQPLPSVQAAPASSGGPASSVPPGSLRARLGAAPYARARELATAAETGVRPISRNPQIEEPESLDTPPPADLPFVPLRLEDVCSRPHAELEAFLAKVYKCIAQGSLEQKVGVLRYLEQISCHMQVADLVVNSSLLRLVLRMLHARRGGGNQGGGSAAGTAAAAAPPLRARLLSLIGQLLRHATYLEPGVADMGIFDVLLEGLRDRDTLVRRRCAAALGELLFYIATQPPPATGGADARKTSGTSAGTGSAGNGAWQIPSTVLQALTHMVSSGEDEIVQHYAVKTIENIATQCPAIAQQWFFAPELIHSLGLHVRRGSRDTFRLSCLAATAHLLRGRPEGEMHPADPDLVTLGLMDLAPQGVSYSLQLVADTLLRAPSVEAALVALPENIVDQLVGVASQPRYAGPLRGRAVLLLALLFVLDEAREARHLRIALDRSYVAHVDRLGREKDRFVVQCIAAVAVVMDVVTAAILQSLVEGLRQLTATADAPAAYELAAGLVQTLPVFLHLLSSATLCTCVLGSRALPLLGAASELAARLPQSSASGPQGDPLHQLQQLVLMVMEAMATLQSLVLEHASQVVRCVLSSLSAFLPSPRSDVRMLAMKAFSDLCIILLNDSHVFDPHTEKPTETTILLEALLCRRALPQLPTLLSDEPPAPSCAVRLLATLLSCGSQTAHAAVRDLGLARQLLNAVEGQQASLTVHTALLACCLLRGRHVQIGELERSGIISAVHSALVDAAEAAVGCPAQMDFALVDAALSVAEEAFVATAIAVNTKANGVGHAVDVQQHVKELGRLARAMPLLAVLCSPLAHAKLVPLLDRATICCEQLAGIAKGCGQDRRHPIIELPTKGMASLLEALATLARWRHSGSQDPSASHALQRRLLAVLSWAVTSSAGASAEVRAELAAGVEQLLRDRVIGDDPVVVADARGLIAAAVGRGAA